MFIERMKSAVYKYKNRDVARKPRDAACSSYVP